MHRSRSFDVLNVHSAHVATRYGLTAVRDRGVPVVVTCHGHDVQRDSSTSYGLRLDPRHDRRIRRNLDRVDRVVAISASMYEDLAEMVEPERIDIVPNGIWIPELKGEGLAEKLPFDPAGEVLILMVGRNHPKKEFHRGIEAFRRLAEHRHDVRLLHVGRGSEQLVREAREMGLGNRFVALGELPREKIGSIYRASDIFLLPSSIESFGLVTVEAMAFGLPCLVTDVPGSRDIVEDRVHGRVVPARDEEAMASALQSLVEDALTRREYGRQARAMAESRYGWPSIANRYLEVFRSCRV